MKVLIYSQKIMDFYNQFINQINMAERRPWTPEQDQVLKHLKDELKVKKWSQISRRLECEFQIPGRNGKQCRQRYSNHLADFINFDEFTQDQEQKLFKLHDKIGNKWSLICKDFVGRTDNQIKNHFHSKLRKAIRKLNKQIKLYFKKTIKPYKLSIVYKIVEASDFRFCTSSCLNQENLRFFNELKNILLQYAGGLIQEKSQIYKLKGKDQTLFIISKLQAFQNHFKYNKMAVSNNKSNKKTSRSKVNQKAKHNHSTSESEFSEVFQSQKMEEQLSEDESIYQEASFQFICQKIDSTIPSIKATDEDVTKPQQNERQVRKKVQIQNEGSFLRRMDCFQINKNLQREVQEKNIFLINSLVEQQEFPDVQVDRKLSIRSFESLKEFQDNYLNDSEINMMLKRFQSCSNIEQRLFE